MNAILAAPAPDIESAKRRVVQELSQGSKVGNVLLLLGSGFATLALACLWLTEDGLPVRTQIAFFR